MYCVCMYECTSMYVRTYACMYVCMCMYVLCMTVCIYVCMYCVCMSVCMHACMFICVCMYYVWMYVCMYYVNILSGYLIVVILIITMLFTLRDQLDILSSASSYSHHQPQAHNVIKDSCFWFLKNVLSKRAARVCPPGYYCVPGFLYEHLH